MFLQVEILAGKDKGAIGKVSQVLRGQNKLFVEGLNCVSLNVETYATHVALYTI